MSHITLDKNNLANELEQINRHVIIDGTDRTKKKFRQCRKCSRPTAGHPPGEDGRYPGYGWGRCQLNKIGNEQINKLHSELSNLQGVHDIIEKHEDLITEERPVCDVCDFTYASLEDLSVHEKEQHSASAISAEDMRLERAERKARDDRDAEERRRELDMRKLELEDKKAERE